MRSKAKVGGHPIHPMLVPVPIGLFVGALAADAAYQFTANVFFYDLAWWAMAGGIVGALAAAIPGLIDYLTVARLSRARAIATSHLIINLTVVGLYLVNCYVRYGHGALTGTAWGLAFSLEVVSIALLSVSGWLGGEMVYRFGIGIEREAMRISMLDEDRVRLEKADEEHVLR